MLNNIFNFEQKFFLTPVRTVNAQTKAATHLFSFGFREYQQKQCEATLERKSTSRFLREARLKTWTKPAPTWEHFTTSQPPNRVICMRLRIQSRKPSSGQQANTLGVTTVQNQQQNRHRQHKTFLFYYYL